LIVAVVVAVVWVVVESRSAHLDDMKDDEDSPVWDDEPGGAACSASG